MKDKGFIPLDGGTYHGCKVPDAQIRYGEEDVLRIKDAYENTDDFYLINSDIVGEPTHGRRKRYGRTWVVDAGDLIA
jgi:hypothetical protein